MYMYCEEILCTLNNSLKRANKHTSLLKCLTDSLIAAENLGTYLQQNDLRPTGRVSKILCTSAEENFKSRER